MTAPVRIQRKRTKGFDLEAASRAINGLPAVYVGRPTMWGNPFSLRDIADAFDCRAATAHALATEHFAEWLKAAAEAFEPMHAYEGMKEQRDAILAHIGELRGKNLVCWCQPDQPCHGDVLLEIANRPIVCEPA